MISSLLVNIVYINIQYLIDNFLDKRCHITFSGRDTLQLESSVLL